MGFHINMILFTSKNAQITCHNLSYGGNLYVLVKPSTYNWRKRLYIKYSVALGSNSSDKKLLNLRFNHQVVFMLDKKLLGLWMIVHITF